MAVGDITTKMATDIQTNVGIPITVAAVVNPVVPEYICIEGRQNTFTRGYFQLLTLLKN